MPVPHRHRTLSHSSVYRIYRRIRFLRYKKKLIRQKNRRLKLLEEKARKELLLRQKEFTRIAKQQQLLKNKAERSERLKRKQELKEELRQRELQARKEYEALSREDRIRAKQKRMIEKKQRRRLLRSYIKLSIRNFRKSIRSFDLQTLVALIREFRSRAPRRKKFAIISFNSTIYFLLSYFFLFFLSQAITVIAAGFFNYPTIVYYHEIFYNISPDSWFHDSVKTIYSSGPLVSFVMGIIFYILYTNLKETTGYFKLFFLWGFLHAVNMLFGAMLVGTLFETGVGHVISWMYIMDTGKVMYSMISVFLLIIAGMMAAKPFLISANSYYTEINRTNRTGFIFVQVILPYLIGNIFLFILRQPLFVFYDTFTLITLFVPILAIVATYRSFKDLFFEEEEQRSGIAWIATLILLAMALFFRIILAKGLHFNG